MFHDDSLIVGVSKMPDDPEEIKKWVKDMVGLQITLWIDGGVECEVCGHQYGSVADFMGKDVRCGGVGKFICGNCWDLYEQLALSGNP